MSAIHSADSGVVDQSDRVFHLEVLRGGMNRLLFRSNKSETWPTRVEILFMNVNFLAIGTLLHGPVITPLGPVAEHAERVAWLLNTPDDLSLFSIRSAEGDGLIVAGSLSLDESHASASDPSSFFMMD